MVVRRVNGLEALASVEELMLLWSVVNQVGWVHYHVRIHDYAVLRRCFLPLVLPWSQNVKLSIWHLANLARVDAGKLLVDLANARQELARRHVLVVEMPDRRVTLIA